MRLLDSNLLIYAARDEYAFLRPLILQMDSCVSIIVKLECLGYRNLSSEDKIYPESVFLVTKVYPIDEATTNRPIRLRQVKKMSLGDSIIAATALLNRLDLYTNNADDFSHIPDLTIVNPLTV